MSCHVHKPHLFKTALLTSLTPGRKYFPSPKWMVVLLCLLPCCLSLRLYLILVLSAQAVIPYLDPYLFQSFIQVADAAHSVCGLCEYLLFLG